MFGLTSRERSDRMALRLAGDQLVAKLTEAGATAVVTGEAANCVAIDLIHRGRLVDTIWLTTKDGLVAWNWGDRAQYTEPGETSLAQVADRVLLTTGVLDPSFR